MGHGMVMPVEKAQNFKGTFRRFLGELRPERKWIGLVVVVAIFSTAGQVFGPKIMAGAIGGDKTAVAAEFARIAQGAARAARLGLEVHAGHGLDYMTAEAACGLPEIVELNIGHFIMGEAICDGLTAVIKRMRVAMTRGRAQLADDEPPSRP